MKIFVGVTDNTWFANLRAIQDLDEVNFWQPSGKAQFQVLSPGEPFLFKLHSPYDFIAGGGFFAHSTVMPISIAWDAFGEKNGAGSFDELRSLIEKKRATISTHVDYPIGCILLVQPFFFEQKDWIPVPSDWRKPIVQGKTYDTATGIGKKLWEEVQLRLQKEPDRFRQAIQETHRDRYGQPMVVRPRLGQGSFRVVVMDTYRRRCAVTQERTFPTLEASHIKPYAESGPHDICNGVLFRADIHRLLDSGYVTISPDYHLIVSKSIKEDFDNGEEYYKMHGSRLYIPAQKELRPAPEFIHWHNENKYKG